jgi:tRNA A-37 threonylcarbamoyl transferase component Bud32/tetratricopeptide (TPR) repeat protein
MDQERWERIKPILSAALERPPGERAALLAKACADDTSLRSDVESLIAAHDGAGAFIDTPVLSILSSAPTAGSTASSRVGLRIGPYQVIRELGHGGMGVVFLATRADDAFRQQVAIKIVRSSIGDADLAQRFRRERQILANLNHPGVARLFDGGATDDGAPYLVMEYVEGVPIDQFCDRNGLDTRERLALFRQVCEAVHYAHRNLVIHRDLKPGNILVTADGAPKLLDFGIAKLLETDGRDGALTVRSFTPDYASPEQIRGEPMTTASDVYSLATLLYLLVTGRRPYGLIADDPLEAARTICEVQPDEPATIAEDLDTILLKALCKEPDRRYGSVEQFSDDIGRYLEGRAVLAMPDTVAYQTGKFIRRHAFGVVTAGVLVVTLSVATVITTWQMHIARRERAVAEHRFNEVRQLANAVVGELHDAIKDLSGATAARKLLVTRAVGYLDHLARESAGDASLQRELAEAYGKMGDAQGNPYLANLGDGAGAMSSYQKAFALHSALAGAHPLTATSRRDLAADNVRIADMLWADGHYAESLERYRVAMGIYEGLAAEDTSRLEDRFNVTRVLNRMGQVQLNAGDNAAALNLYRQSLSQATGLTAAAPQNVTYRRGLGVAALKLGDVAFRLHDDGAAFDAYDRAEHILRQVAAENPASADLRRTFALALGRLAIGHLRLHHSAEAVAANRETLALYETMATADPANVQTQIDMADTYANLGDALSAAGHNAAAAEAIRHGLSIYARNRRYTAGGANFATLHLTLGTVLMKIDPEGALEAYRKAVALFGVEPVRSEDPSKLADSYAGLGDAQAQLAGTAPQALRAAQLQAARRSYEQSLAIWIALRNQHKLAPDQVERPGEIEARIARCSTAARVAQ